jgi:hypothetical protein
MLVRVVPQQLNQTLPFTDFTVEQLVDQKPLLLSPSFAWDKLRNN